MRGASRLTRTGSQGNIPLFQHIHRNEIRQDSLERHGCCFLVVLLLIALGRTALAQSKEQGVSEIVGRIGERVEKYYRDLQKVAWTDNAQVQWLKEDLTPKDKPREATYDMLINLQPPTPDDPLSPFYVREQADLKRVEGKIIKKGAAEATAPRPPGLGSLVFLLQGAKGNYSFSYSGQTSLQARKTLMLEVSYPQSVQPPRVIWNDSFRGLGVNRNFRIAEVQTENGRIWIDPDTYDVLQLEYHTTPFEFSRTDKSKKITYEMVYTARFQIQLCTGSNSRAGSSPSGNSLTIINARSTTG